MESCLDSIPIGEANFAHERLTHNSAAVFNLVKNMVSRLLRSEDRLVPKRLRCNDLGSNDPASATIALAVSWASNGCMPAPMLKVRFYSSNRIETNKGTNPFTGIYVSSRNRKQTRLAR